VADVTAVYSMDDSEALKALNRIEKRLEQHANKAKASMENAGASLGKGFVRTEVLAQAAMRGVQQATNFGIQAVREYAETNSLAANEIKKIEMAWTSLSMGIGRDLSGLLDIGLANWINGLSTVRSTMADILSYVNPIAVGFRAYKFVQDGEMSSPGEINAAQRRLEEQQRSFAVQRLQSEAGSGLAADRATDPVQQARLRARIAFQRESAAIDAIKVNGVGLSNSEKAPLLAIAREREALAITQAQAKATEQAAQAAQKLADVEARAATERARSEELAAQEADRMKDMEQALALRRLDIELMERENMAMQDRLDGRTQEADITEIQLKAEREIARVRAEKDLDAGSKSRSEAAILRRAQLEIAGLSPAATTGGFSGATIAAGAGSLLASQVFAGIGSATDTKATKAIDLAKQQVNILQQIATNTKGQQVAVFGP
jgi:hypothetical protein